MEILTRRRVTTLRSQRFEMHNGYYLLCLVALILVSPQVGFGGTIIAASPSATNVQTAINGAVDGDIVIVPAGSATWTTGVVVSGKSITIQGAGIDQTIITGATGNPSGSFTLYFTAMNRKPFRVTGITFHSDSVLYGFSEVQAQSDSVGFRIDHCKFTNLTRRGIVAGGAQGLAFTEGLIDHCTFEVAGNFSAQGVTVSANTFTEPPAVGPEGSLSSWVILPQWGTSHYVYIEDCTFNFSIRNDDGVELYDGGRAVIRHCAFINTGIGVHGCDSSARSGHSWEIYNNTFNSNIDNSSTQFLEARGGTGVWYNNTVTATGVGASNLNLIYVDCYRATGTHIYPSLPQGTITGANLIDGNLDGTVNQHTSGYPGLDQIGRTSPTAFLSNHSTQPLEPAYAWNNTFNGVSGMPIKVSNVYSDVIPNAADVIQEGRDFYNNTVKPGYTAYVYPHPLVGGTPPPPQNLRTQ